MKRIAHLLKKGGVAVILTDTIYGLVGQALNKKTVGRIYKIKGRRPNKPFIVLISSVADLKLFDVNPKDNLLKVLKKLWPGKVSIILPLPKKSQNKFSYLHRGTKTLAFRLPKKASLRRLLSEAGPLVAPSANPEGLPPARSIAEAQKYFGRQVDFYAVGGQPDIKPSSLIAISGGKIKILRHGGGRL